MTEYTVEFQDENTVVWSFTVTADSKKDAAKQMVTKHLQSNDLTGMHAFVYKSSASVSDSKIFDADEL